MTNIEVSVTFDERRGYVGTAPELRAPVVALSLSSLRRRIEVALLPDAVIVHLRLDRAAARERDQRRSRAQQMAAGRGETALSQPLPSFSNFVIGVS
jgi:hypothetical protein